MHRPKVSVKRSVKLLLLSGKLRSVEEVVLLVLDVLVAVLVVVRLVLEVEDPGVRQEAGDLAVENRRVACQDLVVEVAMVVVLDVVDLVVVINHSNSVDLLAADLVWLEEAHHPLLVLDMALHQDNMGQGNIIPWIW